jgi:hypothetical protein
MSRDISQKSLYLEVKKREKSLVEFRYRNQIQTSIESNQYDKKLGQWEKKGFPKHMLS